MNIQVRKLSLKDYKDLVDSMNRAYGGVGGLWTRTNIRDLIGLFPEGQLCVEVDGRVVACALAIVIDTKKRISPIHTGKSLPGAHFRPTTKMETSSTVSKPSYIPNLGICDWEGGFTTPERSCVSTGT